MKLQKIKNEPFTNKMAIVENSTLKIKPPNKFPLQINVNKADVELSTRCQQRSFDTSFDLIKFVLNLYNKMFII